MLQLAIECSAIHGSIAVCDSGSCAASIGLPTDRSSVQTLAQTVKYALAGRTPSFISVTNGPGSFTGLRVGLTTVKMLGLAWNLPIVAVDTLHVVAYKIATRLSVNRQASDGPLIVVPVINAFRRQVFTSVWLAGTDRTNFPLTDSLVLDADIWLANPVEAARMKSGQTWSLTEYPTRVAIGGPGLENYRPNLSACQFQIASEQTLEVPVEILHGIQPDATAVAELGFQRFQAGLLQSAESLAVNYVRASAAEEKLKS